MQLTKGVISRDEAMRLCPDYVKYVEGNWDLYRSVRDKFSKIKRGQSAITYHEGQFVRVKITMINNNDFRAVDGPVIRVTNGEYSWRVDGNHDAWPI